MIRSIKNFTPPAKSTPYNPVKRVTVPGNDSIEVRLEGRGSKAFGFNRILMYGIDTVTGNPDLLNVTATARLNEDFTVFKPVNLAVIRQLFLRKKLLAPYVIQENNTLFITLENSSANDIDVSIELLGYDQFALNKLQAEYDKRNIPMPKPVLLSKTEEVAASANNQNISIPLKSEDLDIVRMAVKTGSDDDISVSLQILNETVKNQVFVQQLNDEFENEYSFVPFKLTKNVPFSVVASNADAGTAYDLSFLGEAYIIQD